MNDKKIREVAEQIGEKILGSDPTRTRSEELAGVMLAFLNFAQAIGIPHEEIEALLDQSKAMLKTFPPNTEFVN